jgi:hypothetical protein
VAHTECIVRYLFRLSLGALMPLKIDWKAHLFSRSCVDLTRTRNGDGDSDMVVAVSFRGSQLALAKDAITVEPDGRGRKSGRRRSRKEDRRSLPPENCIVEIERPRIKPDVVHWKAKVCGGGVQKGPSPSKPRPIVIQYEPRAKKRVRVSL